jgi:predicted nuclease of predicted toxin-antitoxin system
MHFLADENMPLEAIMAPRTSGHEVVSVRLEAPGMCDSDVLLWAEREERVLLTFDKDFGELAWRAKLPAACGIVLFRMPIPSPSAVGAVLAARIAERSDWADHFSVIEPERVRMRELGSGSSRKSRKRRPAGT